MKVAGWRLRRIQSFATRRLGPPIAVVPPSLPEVADPVKNAGAAMTLIEGCRDLSETGRETLETAVQRAVREGF